MRAVVIDGPGSARVEAAEVPVPGTNQVVVDVHRVGICGTDAELFSGEQPYFAQGKSRFPLRPGHEWCGTVSAVGGGVEDGWLNQRVTGDTMLGCGACARCAAGHRHVCADRHEIGIMGWPGALAEKLLVPASALHRLPDTVDNTAGALVEPGGNAYRAVAAANPEPGRRILVIGPGTIGLLAVAFAAAAGAEVHVLAQDDTRREPATALGAAGYWTPARAPGTSGAPGAPGAPEKSGTPGRHDYDAVIDCTNDHAVPGQALSHVRPAGRVVYIGVSARPSLIDTRDLVLSDVTAVGILAASAGLAPAIAHYADGRVTPSLLATKIVGLGDAPDALAGRISPGKGTKVLIDPRL
jgi:2-desacetyl-2-hydroxyethyl bacteriochlorophyllide A dehydrogenase